MPFPLLRLLPLAALAMAAACQRSDQGSDERHDQGYEAAPPAPAATPVTNTAARDATAPVAEAPPQPEPPPVAIAPVTDISAEGAAQVVRNYFALLEAGRAAAARRLWAEGSAAEGIDLGGGRVEVGTPGRIEGAAGSLYVEVPVRVEGQGGARSGTVTLRRVNDVPGSTAAQRRWHIYRISMAAGPRAAE